MDHFHAKIVASRHYDGALMFQNGWAAYAENESGSVMCVKRGTTKAAAIAALKTAIAANCVRGLLCRQCNRALGMLERFFDAARTPDRVLPYLEYLRARLKKS